MGSVPISLDDPPGNLAYVYYTEGHVRETRSIGHATFVLALPECTPTSSDIQEISRIEGDSQIAICRPAIDVDSPGRSLNFEVSVHGASQTLIGSANAAGRLGKILVPNIVLTDAYQCESAALALVNPLLTHLSHESDVPLYVWQIHIAPAGDSRTWVRVTAPFLTKRHGNRQHIFSPEYQHLGAAYREGLNLLNRSPLFAFLSFYKVVEGGSAIEKRLRKAQITAREPQRIPLEANAAAQWVAEAFHSAPPPIGSLNKWIPPEAMGKKVNWVLDQIRTVRNRVAHGLVDPDQPSKGISSADDPNLLVAVEKWLPLLRAFAKRTLDRSGVREFPLGMPPSMALDIGFGGAP